MVLNTIKYLITGGNSSADKEYNQILQNLSLHKDNSDHQNDIKMIKNGFDRVKRYNWEKKKKLNGDALITNKTKINLA